MTLSFEEIQSIISPKLTWEIFESVLKEHSNSKSVKIIKFTLGNAAVKGDSYLSAVAKFSVEYSGVNSGIENTFKVHVIAKSLLKNVARRKTYRNSDFFANEIVFYDQVWPQMDAFQKGLKPKLLFKEIPKYLCGTFDGENDYVLLEDLSFQNYRSFDRTATLTLEKAKLVLKILAQFHAIGYTFKLLQPELFHSTVAKLKETYFHEDFRPWYSKFQENLIEITLDAVKQELPDSYYHKLVKVLKRDIFAEAIEICCPKVHTKFQTITHGDTWIPNFLTRHDEFDQPIHSVMIDFQLARYGSLAPDLHLFFYACVDAKLRDESYEDMVKYYCQEFNAFWAQLSPELRKNEKDVELTFDDLMKELKDTGMYPLNICMESSIMSCLDDEEVSDLDAIQGEDAVPLDSVVILTLLKTKEKRQKVANIIKHLIDYKFI